MERDLYEVVGVERGATKEQISAAYRRRARALHPDLNPGDPEATNKLTELNKAYTVLSDDGKRLAYDTARDAARIPNPADDLFNFVARGTWGRTWGAPPTPPLKGRDVETEITLTLSEAVMGTSRLIRSRTGLEETCGACGGARGAPGSVKMPCQPCAGTGRSFYPGTGGMREACRNCGGHGDLPHRRCAACAGTGRLRANREVTLKVPSGISDGQRLRMAGQGEIGPSGIAGDMNVTVKVSEDAKFRRKGDDIHSVLRVPFHAAAMGSTVMAPGIDGKDYPVSVPRGMRPGETTVTVPGAGVPSMTGSRGSMKVLLQVDMPEPRTPRGALLLRELMMELSGAEEDDLSPTGWWTK